MVTKIQYKRYNGWRGVRPDVSGWATWNVALWLNNDEGLYRAYRDFARNHKGRLSGSDAEDFVRELLPNGTLIVTRDEANGSIDSSKIVKLIDEVFGG